MDLHHPVMASTLLIPATQKDRHEWASCSRKDSAAVRNPRISQLFVCVHGRVCGCVCHYRMYNPDKMYEVPTISHRYANSQESLNESLKKRYSVDLNTWVFNKYMMCICMICVHVFCVCVYTIWWCLHICNMLAYINMCTYIQLHARMYTYIFESLCVCKFIFLFIYAYRYAVHMKKQM